MKNEDDELTFTVDVSDLTRPRKKKRKAQKPCARSWDEVLAVVRRKLKKLGLGGSVVVKDLLTRQIERFHNIEDVRRFTAR